MLPMNWRIKLKHWWQRNFGHVYLWCGENGKPWYRFRARRGRVALVWTLIFGDSGFICRLNRDGSVIIDDDYYAGYGKQYGSWVWDYEPKGECAGKGGFW